MKRILQAVFGLMFTLSFGGMVILQQFYAVQRPASPQTESGEVTPIIASHNKTVYVTAKDKRWMNLTYWGMAIGGIACIISIYIPTRKQSQAPSGIQNH